MRERRPPQRGASGWVSRSISAITSRRVEVHATRGAPSSPRLHTTPCGSCGTLPKAPCPHNTSWRQLRRDIFGQHDLFENLEARAQEVLCRAGPANMHRPGLRFQRPLGPLSTFAHGGARMCANVPSRIASRNKSHTQKKKRIPFCCY